MTGHLMPAPPTLDHSSASHPRGSPPRNLPTPIPYAHRLSPPLPRRQHTGAQHVAVHLPPQGVVRVGGDPASVLPHPQHQRQFILRGTVAAAGRVRRRPLTWGLGEQQGAAGVGALPGLGCRMAAGRSRRSIGLVAQLMAPASCLTISLLLSCPYTVLTHVSTVAPGRLCT